MKPLTLKETKLKEEMKNNCLKGGKYKDEKAKDKFKMLCHLEDFEVQYWELQQENKQLKDNWNNLKKIAKMHSGIKKKCYNGGLWFEIDSLLDKMQELEQGSDSND